MLQEAIEFKKYLSKLLCDWHLCNAWTGFKTYGVSCISRAEYHGDNFVRFSGDAQQFAKSQSKYIP